MKFYYADRQTVDFLNEDTNKVYLYGGFVGYNNFGDIIQLKYAIDYHKKNSKADPVVILHIGSLEHREHVKELISWYDVRYFLFISDSYVDASDAGLFPVISARAGGLLHVYGGGYLNKYWGAGIIQKIRALIDDFRIGEYFFSGQQIEKQVIPDLNELFEKKQPLVFGVRDKDSLDWMKEDSIVENLDYSFDDVTEILQGWKKAHKIRPQVALLNKVRPKSVLWHINVSNYATVNQERILERIRRVKRDLPKDRMLVAQAYNDIRLSLRDSLQSIIQLENKVPYYEYKVINIAQMALDINHTKGIYPNISDLFDSISRCVSSSYHTAMLALMFGKPTFLMSDNAFYSQKQKALGLGNDFGVFMSNEKSYLNDFDDEIRARSEWHERLGRTLEMASESLSNRVHLSMEYAIPEEVNKIKYRNINS